MNKNQKISPLLLLLIIIIIGFSLRSHSVQAQTEITPHLIIHEIQIAGANGNDEFVELFNPTSAPIDLSGYKLSKKTKGGTESALVSAAKFSGIIQAYGHFLISHPDYKDKIAADFVYSSSTYYISSDNTILLYDKDGTLLDKVGFGAATDFESTPAPNPDAGKSIERKNFSDTNKNSADFLVNSSPSPQNSNFTESDQEKLPGNSNLSPGKKNDEEIPVDIPADISSSAPNPCPAVSPNIKINEVFPYPASGNEFVEIKNTGEKCVDVSGWKIMDEAGHKKEFPAGSIVEPEGYLYLEGNLYLNNDSDTVYLLDKGTSAKNNALDYIFFEKAQKGFSYSFNDGNWLWTTTPTPGAKNVIMPPTLSNVETTGAENNEGYFLSTDVRLNEIFPNPKEESDEEYIELKNGGSEPVDLFKWTLRDESKTGKYVFKDHTLIEPNGYLVIYKSQSKIALNNSGESVHLHNPKNELVSTATYQKSIKNSSYNFNGSDWSWSKFLTPGAENKFDSKPKIKIQKPKNVFKDIAVEFSANAKDKETKKLKYVWDFGDGKKSYLKKTKHKYPETGKYKVTLSVSDESQTIEKSFGINVKKAPRPDLEITKIVPNPAGADTDGEIIDIKNNSGKKVDLKGWKIATGPGKKMYNHPIADEFVINPDKAKTVTREVSKFSLNNKAGRVALIMPDGKIIDEVEYSKDKIADDEVYEKINDKWQWITLNNKAGTASTSVHEEEETEFIDDPTGEIEAEEENSGKEDTDGKVLGAVDENISNYAPQNIEYSSEDKFIFFKLFGLLNYKSRETNYCPINPRFATLAYF